MESIARNERLIAMLEARQRTLESAERFKVGSLDQLTGVLERKRTEQEAELDRLAAGVEAASYEDLEPNVSCLPAEIDDAGAGRVQSSSRFTGWAPARVSCVDRDALAELPARSVSVRPRYARRCGIRTRASRRGDPEGEHELAAPPSVMASGVAASHCALVLPAQAQQGGQSPEVSEGVAARPH